MPTEATEHPTTGVDISSAAFWARPLVERDESFAWLRANAPISWHPPIESAAELGFTRTGFWAITRAADITSVSMHHDVFSSVFRRNLDNELNDPNFLGMDPPDHTRYRNMISAAFTPKGVARLREKLGERSAALVEPCGAFLPDIT